MDIPRCQLNPLQEWVVYIVVISVSNAGRLTHLEFIGLAPLKCEIILHSRRGIW